MAKPQSCHAFVIPNGQLTLPLGCLACFYPVRKLLLESTRKARFNCNLRVGIGVAHVAHAASQSTKSAALCGKEKQKLRLHLSLTEFLHQAVHSMLYVPYTDAFTKVTTERSSLVSSKVDTGYSSITTYSGHVCLVIYVCQPMITCMQHIARNSVYVIVIDWLTRNYGSK